MSSKGTDVELVPVWNGEMEARGEAPGLSSYRGRSSIYYSATFEKMDSASYGDGTLSPLSNRKPRKKPRRIDAAEEAEILRLLKAGCPYTQIVKLHHVGSSVVRRIAKQAGIDRAHWKGHHTEPGRAEW